MSRETSPKRLGERLFDACVAVAIMALLLYAAVWLLQQVWMWLLGAALVAGGWWLWRQHNGW